MNTKTATKAQRVVHISYHTEENATELKKTYHMYEKKVKQRFSPCQVRPGTIVACRAQKFPGQVVTANSAATKARATPIRTNQASRLPEEDKNWRKEHPWPNGVVAPHLSTKHISEPICTKSSTVPLEISVTTNSATLPVRAKYHVHIYKCAG